MPTRRTYVPQKIKLRVRRAPKGMGLGLHTEEAISKDTCIIEYTGRVISKEEEEKSRSRYLFTVNRTVTIDGAGRSNIARYINHSCKPNAEAVIHKNRIYIFAIRNILAGEAIAYDYGKEYFDEYLSNGRCKCSACTA